MQALFAATLFVSAFLLFLVQPLVGRMLLPLLGGSPAVWNTCMVFFQTVLLAGYGYSHFVASRLSRRGQVILHLIVLALPAVALPIAVSENATRAAAETSYPIFFLLKILLLAVCLPFFVVSTTGPLLQRWFAHTGHRSARDPYFLYAASNLGGMLALLAYPVVFEPFLRLNHQSAVWAVGYGLCAVLIVACAIALWKAPEVQLLRPASLLIPPAPAAPTRKRRARWILLAFVPSSLLLGTTTYLSTDVAPIPLLWIIPLALYLLTFILVFAKQPPLPHAWMNRLLPIAIVILTLILLTGATEMRGLPVGFLLILSVIVFFLAAMVGHGELARDRPAAEHLTEFYLWISVGGVLGGLFNALLAPLLFRKTGLTEYPVALVLACFLLRPRAELAVKTESGIRSHALWVKEQSVRKRRKANKKGSVPGPHPDLSIPNEDTNPRRRLVLDAAIALSIGALTLGLIMLAMGLGLEAGPMRTAVMFALPCLLIYLQVERPVRLGLVVAAVLLAGATDPDETLQYRERNFFGVLKVSEIRTSATEHFRLLYHGSTRHGQQDLIHTDSEGRREPLTYYHRTGPLGHVFSDWQKPRSVGQHVGAVGLGAGSVAYYARPGDDWTFYEIDPAIVRLAEDPKYFSFLSECRARSRRMIVGDARLRLREALPNQYDLLVLDGFSSDAIPMHLITKEALQLYVDKLADGGIIAFHVSNRYLRLQPFLAKLAENTNPKLVARQWHDTEKKPSTGKEESQWVILARFEADFGPLARDVRWERLWPAADTPLWTDDFSNLFSAFQW
jgi:hypothetical protein